VRKYTFLSSAAHFKIWDAKSERTEICSFPTNPLSSAPVLRAVLRNMEAWVGENRTPPARQYPSIANGTLVALKDLKLPDLNLGVVLPVYNELRLRDHSTVPPTASRNYPVYVPQLDDDGNPLGGVRDPAIAAPLGTSWGWNLRNKGFAQGDLCGLDGSYIAFAETQQDGHADSRAPIDRRYADKAAYTAAVGASVDKLVEAGFMLAEDRQIILDRGAKMFTAAIMQQ
jgi:hypothetical protein